MKILYFLATILVAISSSAQKIKTKEIKERLSGVSKTKREYSVLHSDKTIKHGFYKEYYKKTAVVSGEYKLNKKEGTWIYKDPEENYLQKGAFNNGKKVGEWVLYYDGKLRKKEVFNENNRLDSLFVYNDNNQVKESFYYNNAKQLSFKRADIGLGFIKEEIKKDKDNYTVKFYYPSGELLQEKKFKDKKLVYVSDFYRTNGRVLISSLMKNGNGVLLSLFLDKLLEKKYISKVSVTYKDGIPNGDYKEYDTKGKVLVSGTLLGKTGIGEWKTWSKKLNSYTVRNYKKNAKKKFNVNIVDFSNTVLEIPFAASSDPVKLMENRKKNNADYHKKEFTYLVNECLSRNLNTSKIAYYMPENDDGVYKIAVMFRINTLGEVSGFKVRSSSKKPEVKQEVIKALEKLPVLIPASKEGRVVNLLFSQPIVFRTKKAVDPFADVNQQSNRF
ncbi:antitoxin component YwqK of YwqJK toxin-antitoxin module [Wenyingzhuangia heitensis]|uniref:Antitoxin component YwqK of YwqJK toxin-antitoxin module n=1 Tax=Wenyingzhuangia heitensis TaxID=1487859 RepID=A0ABX0UBH1_9FLAO|nr:hypothetical protein [Wenyingzhuangia heitensis]NIJ44417.1 antitoxin component YwqK of YwqJK toxin-antitoxin module [Wenyingzhuangia heitensis]